MKRGGARKRIRSWKIKEGFIRSVSIGKARGGRAHPLLPLPHTRLEKGGVALPKGANVLADLDASHLSHLPMSAMPIAQIGSGGCTCRWRVLWAARSLTQSRTQSLCWKVGPTSEGWGHPAPLKGWLEPSEVRPISLLEGDCAEIWLEIGRPKSPLCPRR